MKSNRLLRSMGIVFKGEIHEIRSFVKNEYGKLPDSQTWNDIKIEESARKFLKKQKYDQAKESLLELIKLHPYQYISGLSKTIGSALFELLNLFYTIENGEDFRLEKESCLLRMIEHIESDMPLRDIIPKMREEIDKEPNVYLIITEKGAKKMAEKIFSEIRPDLSKSLPDGFQMRERAINDELAKLIVDRVSMNSLMENLMGQIKANPLQYFIAPPPKDRGPVDYAQRS